MDSMRTCRWWLTVFVALGVAIPMPGIAATAVKVAIPFDSLNYFPTFSIRWWT